MNNQEYLTFTARLTGFILCVVIIFIWGFNNGVRYTQKQAIDHNTAYYNPTNAIFTWKEIKQ